MLALQSFVGNAMMDFGPPPQNFYNTTVSRKEYCTTVVLLSTAVHLLHDRMTRIWRQ
jgi:hypothetical protein